MKLHIKLEVIELIFEESTNTIDLYEKLIKINIYSLKK